VWHHVPAGWAPALLHASSPSGGLAASTSDSASNRTSAHTATDDRVSVPRVREPVPRRSVLQRLRAVLPAHRRGRPLPSLRRAGGHQRSATRLCRIPTTTGDRGQAGQAPFQHSPLNPEPSAPDFHAREVMHSVIHPMIDGDPLGNFLGRRWGPSAGNFPDRNWGDLGSPANPVKAWRGAAARTGWCELSLDRECERAEAAASRVRIRPF
jgi:hypothetical protein